VGAAGVSGWAGVVVGTAGAAGVDEQSLQTVTTEEVAGLTTVHPPGQFVIVRVVASVTV
jgi:hypothetical protein